MLHALLPAYIHRQSDEHLLELIHACEKALLDGTSTHGDMTTLVECEKEMLQREHARVRRTLAGIRPQDFIDPKVSLSSLAASHPVDLPAEVFATESGRARPATSKTAPAGRPVQTRASQVGSGASRPAPRVQVKPERFNLMKAVARRFGVKQAVVQKSVAQQPVQKARAVQPSPKRQSSNSERPEVAPGLGRPGSRTQANPAQTKRRTPALQRAPNLNLQD